MYTQLDKNLQTLLQINTGTKIQLSVAMNRQAQNYISINWL